MSYLLGVILTLCSFTFTSSIATGQEVPFEVPDGGIPNEPRNIPPGQAIPSMQTHCNKVHNLYMSNGTGYALFAQLDEYRAVCFVVNTQSNYSFGQFSNGRIFPLPRHISPQECANYLRATKANSCQ